jgi:hypothetical protein
MSLVWPSSATARIAGGQGTISSPSTTGSTQSAKAIPRSSEVAGRRSAAPVRSARARAQVVGMDVGVEYLGDAGAEPLGEIAIEGCVGGGIDDQRLGAEGDQVREAAAPRSLHLHDLDARQAEVHGVALQGPDPAAHAVLQHRRVDAGRPERVGDALRGPPTFADDGDLAAQAVGDARDPVEDRRGGQVDEGDPGAFDPPFGVLADVEDGDRLPAGDHPRQFVRCDQWCRLGHRDPPSVRHYSFTTVQ